MKKTLTVNLGGTVYHIDEDAYNLLDNYLNNLRYHFRKEEGADEIVRDMETRIAELFMNISVPDCKSSRWNRWRRSLRVWEIPRT